MPGRNFGFGNLRSGRDCIGPTSAALKSQLIEIAMSSSRHHARRGCCVTLLLACVCSTVAGCTNAPSAQGLIELSGETMGTRYSVKLDELPESVSRDRLQSELDVLLEAVNDQMSTYRPESELSRFNRHGDTAWFEVSLETAAVVREALLYSETSGGAFDPTVGPLVDLWNFGPGRGEPVIPGKDQVVDAINRIGFHLVSARLDPPAIKKDRVEVELDLSAIAKGFAVDLIAEHLDAYSIGRYMIEIGGEVRTRGTKPGGAAWKIGIVKPVPDATGTVRQLARVLPLEDASLATSGDYRNFYVIDGKRYSHTIDPRTGWPVEHAMASVTVVGPTCMQCDALATTLMVLGPKAGYNFAVDNGIAALMLVRSGEDFVEKATPVFDKRFSKP